MQLRIERRFSMLGLVRLVLGIVGGLLFVWLFPMKLVAKLAARAGHSSPCPASLSWLVDNPMRRRYVLPVLDRVGIRAEDRVLELGPGPGIFTLEAARRAGPKGRLCAADIQPEMIAQLKKRMLGSGLNNIDIQVGDAHHLPLADKSVDKAFLVTVLAEIPEPVRALTELHRVLAPGGRLSVTEEFWDPDYPRAETTTRWAEAAGFELEARHGNWWLYTLNFRMRT